MQRYIYGLHDAGGEELMANEPGWILHTIDINATPSRDFRQWSDRGFGNIARLNNGYHPNGTIPSPDKYDVFAQQCAFFVANSPGLEYVVIGNEPNHENEWPNGVPPKASQYAKCFNLCYEAIRGVGKDVGVLVAGPAPWNQSVGDWKRYFLDVLSWLGNCDGFAIHAYTHGTGPELIYSNDTVHGWYWHFRVYREQIGMVEEMDNAAPGKFPVELPFFITETDQDVAWADTNSGWVTNAYAEIDDWNLNHDRKVYCVCLYRWPVVPGDRWGIENKPGVINDFKAALAFGFPTPASTPLPPRPAPAPEPEPPADALPEREIDPKLALRGVHFDYVRPPAGTGYWRIVRARWLEYAAVTVGPDHHILGTVMQEGEQVPGVRLRVDWPTDHTFVKSKKDDPNASFNYDYGMGPSLNEYSIIVDDGVPSDSASGIGMGKGGNSKEHSSTWIDFEWAVSQGAVVPPILLPPVPAVRLVHPLRGSVITQHFWENAADYARFGLPGHNGTDLAGVPVGTNIVALADGVVAFYGTDRDYGRYLRIVHEPLFAYSFYAHCDALLAEVGQTVKAGDIIATVGSTGNSTGPHLHLEIRGMDKSGDYILSSPMPKGRLDPESWCGWHGLKL